jgi:hypothetical protein
MPNAMPNEVYEWLWDIVCFINLCVLALSGWTLKKNQDIIKEIMQHLVQVATNLQLKEQNDRKESPHVPR